MPSVYLIRHGQAAFGHADYDQLSALGEKQTKLLGQHLAKANLSNIKVFSGAMNRHRASLEFFTQGFHQTLPPHAMASDWNEYDHEAILGALDETYRSPDSLRAHLTKQDNPKKAFAMIFGKAIQRWMSGKFDADYPESFDTFRSRVESALEQVRSNLDKEQTALVFTSGGPISWLVTTLLEAPRQKWLDINWTLVNSGVTKLILSSQGWRLSSMNEHYHLQAEDPSWITYT